MSYDEATGTFICRSCHRANQCILSELQRFRDAGLRERVRTWDQYKELCRIRASEKPAFVRNKGRKGEQPVALIAARRAGQGGMSGATAVRAQMAARWRHGVTLQATLCRWCGQLLLHLAAATNGRYEFHRACFDAARREPEGRLWLSRRRHALQDGMTSAECDKRFGARIPVPTRPGRRPTSEDLTRNFGWAVRYLLGDETQVGIAKKAGLTQQTVAQKIKDIIELLPAPELATGHFRAYIELLQEAAGKRHAGHEGSDRSA